MVIAAAAAGIVADLVAARVAGQHGTARTTAAAALVAAAVAYGMVVHAPHTWHGRLMPLWAWGWLVVADLDLRTRFVLDLHVAVLGVVAVLAAVLDRETVLSVAGAAGGVALANALSGALLRDGFAALMVLVAAQLVHRALHGGAGPAERSPPAGMRRKGRL